MISFAPITLSTRYIATSRPKSSLCPASSRWSNYYSQLNRLVRPVSITLKNNCIAATIVFGYTSKLLGTVTAPPLQASFELPSTETKVFIVQNATEFSKKLQLILSD